jgi:hypothetical protein
MKAVSYIAGKIETWFDYFLENKSQLYIPYHHEISKIDANISREPAATIFTFWYLSARKQGVMSQKTII